ncbi:helix-turn-helix transcriptional regulator [Actinoplanes sp. NPDC049316]|uniref:helix-turn-helix domain-containing protein n=1 Tax=Actinoplanes sp. NPDC049316 TaxID=3154727 RepID=UPI0034289B51
MTETDQISPGALSDQVAAAIARIRNQRRMPYTELSTRLEAIGRPIPVLGLRRIEKGERRVDVDELAALARALGVPAISLIFPLGTVGPVVEVLPNRLVEAEDAMLWFIGEGPLPLSAEEIEQVGSGNRDSVSGLHEAYARPDAGWEAAAAPVLLRRRHQALVDDWYSAPKIGRRLASDPASFEQMVFKLRAAAEDGIRDVRAEMRRHGLTPPRLPGELAHFDNGSRAEGSRVDGGKEE